MSLGFGFSLPAYLGAGGAFSGAALNLDFTSGNNTLSPAVTFSRTTNATLTNSAGLVANAPMNLLTFSEQFDNAVWTALQASVTTAANNATAPNGSVTADTVTFTGSSYKYASYATGLLTNQTYTFSVWVSSLTGKDTIGVRMSANTTSSDAVFSLVSLTTTPTRVSVTRTFTSTDTSIFVGFDNRSAIVGGAQTTGSVVVWGAQLELGSTATTYNPTTVKNLLGYTENFDNAAWTKSNAFVQTNLLTYSEQFDNGAWSKAAATVAADSTTAPDGTTTADSITFTGAGSSVYRGQAILTTGVTYTGSVWLKTASGTGTIVLKGAAGTSPSRVTVTDTWQRFTVTYAAANASDGLTIERTLVGDLGSVIVWGAQLVQGASAGDYKATYAAAAAVGYTDIYGQPFAQKLVENTANAGHFVEQSITGGPRTTGSYYVKAGERTKCETYLIDSVGIVAGSTTVYNLANGTVESGSGSITDIGNGWYRVGTTATLTAGAQRFRLLTYTTADVYTGDGTSGIYIFGAQLSDSASVDPYVYQPVAAPTSTAYYGPRFDYDPVTLAPKGLLIEEQRTQLLLNSSLAGTSLATQNVTVTAVAHTLSFYGTGTVALSGTSTAGPLVGSGAYPIRSTLTFTPTAGTLTLTVTGTVQFAQLEVGSFATSFIPSAASQVTRAADSASIIGNNFARWYTQGVGTAYSEFDFVAAPLGTGNKGVYSLYLNASNNITSYASNSAGKLSDIVADGGVAQAAFTSVAVLSANTVYKDALAFSLNDFSRSLNGAAVQTDASGTVPLGLTTLRLGWDDTSTPTLNGHIKRFAYYPRRLANTELQGITS
jgi:hypothetical protein